MKVNLPRGLQIDIFDIPKDIEEIIRQTFHDYTQGTAKAYRYQDKLCFIDRCVEMMHRCTDEIDAVKQLILDREEFVLDEYGELPDRDEYWSLDFLGECYNQGKKDMQMYARYYTDSQSINLGDKHLNDRIMKLLELIIKVVINYED